ncbi:MAG: hypothetical protein WA775_03775 [Psychroserpens sp.]|uniref:hypothetical protein n=1 Tax=Psychroserpens sp. TaxID=2020870 RepID=UPI003C706AA3
MRVLKTIFDFYINSSIHVALAVYALSWLTLLQFGIHFDEPMLLFIFFSSITGYNFVKYFGLAKFHHRSLADWLRIIQVFSLVCFFGLCFFALQLKTTTLLYVGIFAIATFLYAVPLIPKAIFLDQQMNLRSISGLKIYVIALVWTGVTVFLPLMNNEQELSNDVLIVAGQRFVFVMALMLPFEIRDLSYDSLRLSTIPQKIGVKRTKILGLLLLIAFMGFEFLKSIVMLDQILVSGAISVLLLIVLLFSKKNQIDYYSSFFVEGIPIIWLLLLLMIR